MPRKIKEEAKDNQGRSYTLTYPRLVWLARAGIAALLAAAALTNWALAWVRFVRPLLHGATLTSQPIRPLLSANIGLLLAIWSVGLVFAFLPDLAVTAQGLMARTLFGWRPVPWNVVTGIRTVSFIASARRLVIVHGRWGWGGLWSPLVSICLGAGLEPALLFTSEIRDFDPLFTRLREQVGRCNPNALFDDEFFSLPARLVFEPKPALAGLADQSREEKWPLIISAQAMIAVSAGLLAVQLLVMAFHNGWWWQPLIVVAAFAAEWAAGAIYLYALSAIFPGEVDFHQAALLYPIAQIPRALLAVPMLALVAVGLPAVAIAVGIGSVVWAVWLTSVLAQHIYRLPRLLPALAGASIQALFQFMLLALVFA